MLMRLTRKQRAVSLVEVLIALAILSTLALPMGMFLIEYSRGSARLGDYYQAVNLVEQHLEMALSMHFSCIPLGEVSDTVITDDEGRQIDLRPVELSGKTIMFTMKTELIPVDFAALRDPHTRELQRARVEEGMKRIEVTAKWGDKGRQNISLISYRANL